MARLTKLLGFGSVRIPISVKSSGEFYAHIVVEDTLVLQGGDELVLEFEPEAAPAQHDFNYSAAFAETIFAEEVSVDGEA